MKRADMIVCAECGRRGVSASAPNCPECGKGPRPKNCRGCGKAVPGSMLERGYCASCYHEKKMAEQEVLEREAAIKAARDNKMVSKEPRHQRKECVCRCCRRKFTFVTFRQACPHCGEPSGSFQCFVCQMEYSGHPARISTFDAWKTKWITSPHNGNQTYKVRERREALACESCADQLDMWVVKDIRKSYHATRHLENSGCLPNGCLPVMLVCLLLFTFYILIVC